MQTNVNNLDSFDVHERRATLAGLARGPGLPAAGSNVNMHAHSFYSFNAEGWSPSRVAWECRRAGLYAAGLCDFDVLDGVEEFLDAGLALGLRAAAHIETRVFLADMREVEITSPGEPGVTYIMGAGFVRSPAAGTRAADDLAAYRRRAGERNQALIARIHQHLPEIALDYVRDVMTLTPAGNATERHIIRAYVRQAAHRFGEGDSAVAFWSGVLGKDGETTRRLMAEAPRFEEAVRARLVKRGGLGYEQPSESTFPRAADFTAWVRACGALPMITWLDGTSAGERDAQALLDCMCGHGCVAMNIVPDRNWNIADPEERRRKIANLGTIVAEAERRGLPLNIGTEMNRHGLPFVDDLNGEALRPHRAAFLRGARIMAGHSLLARYADYGYLSPAAEQDLTEVKERNAFFEAIGALPPLTEAQARDLQAGGAGKALDWFRRGLQ